MRMYVRLKRSTVFIFVGTSLAIFLGCAESTDSKVQMTGGVEEAVPEVPANEVPIEEAAIDQASAEHPIDTEEQLNLNKGAMLDAAEVKQRASMAFQRDITDRLCAPLGLTGEQYKCQIGGYEKFFSETLGKVVEVASAFDRVLIKIGTEAPFQIMLKDIDFQVATNKCQKTAPTSIDTIAYLPELKWISVSVRGCYFNFILEKTGFSTSIKAVAGAHNMPLISVPRYVSTQKDGVNDGVCTKKVTLKNSANVSYDVDGSDEQCYFTSRTIAPRYCQMLCLTV